MDAIVLYPQCPARMAAARKENSPARNRVTWDGKYMYSQLEPSMLLSDNHLIRRMSCRFDRWPVLGIVSIFEP